MSYSDGARYEVFIRPLPLDFAYGRGQAALNSLFQRFGTITGVEIRSDRLHAFALVEFHSQSAALRAIYEVHGSLVCGWTVSVTWSEASLKSFRTRYDVKIEQHPWNFDKARIIELTASFGPTLVDVVLNPITTSAKAFAYVRFAQAEAAQRAIDELDGIFLDGVEVSVSWQWTPSLPGKELIVRFLPFDVSIRTIRNLFGKYGRLTNVDIARDRTSGEKVGTAYVQILHDTDAERAIDALDGHMMSHCPIRVTWARASRPSGHVVRVVDLAEIVDRRMLMKVFRRYGELRCIEVDYNGLTGRSTRTAFVTFAVREDAQAVLNDFGGYFLRNGQGIISMPMGKFWDPCQWHAADIEQERVKLVLDQINSELERLAAAETAPVSGSSGSALPRTAIPDLLTNTVIHITAIGDQVDPSMDLIDLSDPSPSPPISAVDIEPSAPSLPSSVVSPVEVGHIYAEMREYEIPVHFYAMPESEKLEMATQILLKFGGYMEQDVNNNEPDKRNTKVTLVARSATELVAAMRLINAAGVDCFTCDDPSIRGGHSFHPSEFMTVNVTMAPACSKIKYSQHVVFLSPIDDPEDIGAAMDIMMLQRTDVNLVSVLFDESDDDQRVQVSLMLNLLR